MTKNIQYLYLGENGSILSPVKLPNVYCINKYRLIADTNCKLTSDNINFYDSVLVSESELNDWYEVELNGQKTSIK